MDAPETRRRHRLAPALAVATAGVLGLAGCSSGDDTADRAGTTTTAPVESTAATAAALSWDATAAADFNGTLPPATPATVCGADDRRFLGELLEGSPMQFKIAKRLAEVKPIPSQVVISGTAKDPSLGEGDFPFDHTMGSDFNMDVELDEPFIGVGQDRAKPTRSVHVELAEGQLPHLPGDPNPATLDWTEMSDRSREDLQEPFLPKTGDRVLVMGTWIVDCGHENFQTELHPLTFMAVAHTEGDATVVHTFYNPYRETQLYNADPAKTTDFSVAGRLDDPGNVPFPKGLVDSIARVALGQPATSSDVTGLASWAVLAPNTVSPVAWQVCPPGSPSAVQVGAEVIARQGAAVDIERSGGCARVTVDLSSMTPAEPEMRTCVTRWDFLSEVAGEEASSEEREGETSLDLRKEIAKFLPESVMAKLDADPVMNCYDPLRAEDLGDVRPTKVDVSTDPEAQMPFVGTLVVGPAR